jgi:hypothetical protein
MELCIYELLVYLLNLLRQSMVYLHNDTHNTGSKHQVANNLDIR